jgi:ABC-2 type transport system permease protein
VSLVLVMAANDLRRRLRDRSAIITAVVAPLALASIISVALGGATAGFEATIGVVDADNSDASRSLVGQLLGGGDRRGADESITFSPEPSEQVAATKISDGDLGAALVVPPGFGAALTGGTGGTGGNGGTGGRPMPLRVLRDAERPVTGDVAAAIAQNLVARLDATQLSVALVGSARPQPPDAIAGLANRASQGELPINLRDAAATDDLPLAAYFGPSMAMVFLFLTVGYGARSLLAERRQGTLSRLRAAPTTPGAIVTAKTLSVLALGLGSILTLWLAISLLFRAPWGSPPLVLALCVATVFAIAGISALITAVAKTEEQAEGLTSTVTFTLAIIGGNFVPPDAFPRLLATLSLLTPNGWALRAFSDVAAGDAGWVDILPALAILIGIGTLTGMVAVRFIGRIVRA